MYYYRIEIVNIKLKRGIKGRCICIWRRRGFKNKKTNYFI